MAGLLVLLGMVAFWAGVIAFFKPLPKLKLGSKRAATLAMVLGVGSCGVGGALMPPTEQAADNPGAAPERASRPGIVVKISAEEYAAIENGMSYEQVVAIVGEGGEEMSSSNIAGISTIAYSWQNFDGSNAMLMFQNGALVQKSQFGL